MVTRRTLRWAAALCGTMVLAAVLGREFLRPSFNRLLVQANLRAMVVIGEPKLAPYAAGSRNDQLFHDGYHRGYLWAAGQHSQCPPTFAVVPRALTQGWTQGLAAGKRELGAKARRLP